MVNNLNAEALRNALVVASMEYCKKYLEGQNVVKQDGKLLAVKHVKDSAKCGLKEAKDFVDTYCDYVWND